MNQIETQMTRLKLHGMAKAWTALKESRKKPKSLPDRRTGVTPAVRRTRKGQPTLQTSGAQCSVPIQSQSGRTQNSTAPEDSTTCCWHPWPQAITSPKANRYSSPEPPGVAKAILLPHSDIRPACSDSKQPTSIPRSSCSKPKCQGWKERQSSSLTVSPKQTY